MSLTTLVPKPDADSINGNASACPTNELIRRYGWPRAYASIGSKCAAATSPFWATRMVTEDVGPFKVTGHRLAVAQLRLSLAALKSKYPEVYAALGTAGMLCVRWVRGHDGLLSNHGLGLAVDLTLAGSLDERGDDMVQAGMLKVYEVFKAQGWFWGAEFSVEDGMHFEISAELVRSWIKAGAF